MYEDFHTLIIFPLISVHFSIYFYFSLLRHPFSVSPFYFLFQFFISSSSVTYRFLSSLRIFFSFSFFSVLFFPFYVSSFHSFHQFIFCLSFSAYLSQQSPVATRKCVCQLQTHILITNSRSRGLLPCRVDTKSYIPIEWRVETNTVILTNSQIA